MGDCARLPLCGDSGGYEAAQRWTGLVVDKFEMAQAQGCSFHVQSTRCANAPPSLACGTASEELRAARALLGTAIDTCRLLPH
jgi:hypothetical protein